MFKASDYLVFSFILLIFSLGLMAVGIDLLDKNVYLSDESKAYIYTYSGLASERLNISSLKQAYELDNNTGNLTTTQENYDYSREYIDTLKEKNKISFVLTLVKNTPTFILLSLGLPIEKYALYIDIIDWFLAGVIIIVGVLFIKGVI